MTTSIDAVIQKAQEAAAQVAGGVPAAAPATSVPTAAAGNPLTLGDLASGSLDVDTWLKVNAFGLLIGNSEELFSEIEVTIDTDEIQLFRGIRYGNPARYKRTYDGVTVAGGGGLWIQALEEAREVDPNVREYRGADLVFTLRETLKGKKDKVIAEEGTRLGHSTSVTGWKPFLQFVRDISKMGLPINDRGIPSGVFNLTLGFTTQKNDKGSWGVLAFNDIQRVDD